MTDWKDSQPREKRNESKNYKGNGCIMRYEDWLPTVDGINALPTRVKNYVHDLQTNCDPAGMVAENTLLRDQTKMLDKYINYLKVEHENYIRKTA